MERVPDTSWQAFDSLIHGGYDQDNSTCRQYWKIYAPTELSMPPPSGTSVIAHRIEPPAGPRTPCVMHGDTELERERAQGEDETAGFLYLNRRAALSLLIPILVSFHVLLTALSTNYSKSDRPISTSALPFLSCQGRCTKNRFLLYFGRNNSYLQQRCYYMYWVTHES